MRKKMNVKLMLKNLKSANEESEKISNIIMKVLNHCYHKTILVHQIIGGVMICKKFIRV